jgi:hypothetical protein
MGAYPLIDGIPVLLAPEMLVSLNANVARIDTTVDPYREAYEEMAFYEEVAAEGAGAITESPSFKDLQRAASTTAESFPDDRSRWLDAVYDVWAQWDSYQHLRPVEGHSTLQVGGMGTHAVKFLFAGAAESWLITPMLSEIRFARKMAEHFGVADRLHCVAGIAEQLPFADGSFARIYAPGCLHHTVTELSAPEIERVLATGGRFAAMEPWKAPLYDLGIKVFGKREVGVNCRPLNRERVSPIFETFDDARVVHHGALTRYGLLALQKMKLGLSLEQVWRITQVDDRITNLVPFVRKQGSSVAVLASKAA